MFECGAVFPAVSSLVLTLEGRSPYEGGAIYGWRAVSSVPPPHVALSPVFSQTGFTVAPSLFLSRQLVHAPGFVVSFLMPISSMLSAACPRKSVVLAFSSESDVPHRPNHKVIPGPSFFGRNIKSYLSALSALRAVRHFLSSADLIPNFTILSP